MASHLPPLASASPVLTLACYTTHCFKWTLSKQGEGEEVDKMAWRKQIHSQIDESGWPKQTVKPTRWRQTYMW